MVRRIWIACRVRLVDDDKINGCKLACRGVVLKPLHYPLTRCTGPSLLRPAPRAEPFQTSDQRIGFQGIASGILQLFFKISSINDLCFNRELVSEF